MRILVTVVLLLALGCSDNTRRQPRMRYMERVDDHTKLFENTETGDVWLKSSGAWGAARWTRLEVSEEGREDAEDTRNSTD